MMFTVGMHRSDIGRSSEFAVFIGSVLKQWYRCIPSLQSSGHFLIQIEEMDFFFFSIIILCCIIGYCVISVSKGSNK